MTTQGYFRLTLMGWACAMYALLVISVLNESWQGGVFAVLFASPILLAVLAVTVEYRSLMNVFNVDKQSWSFMFGDTFALTAAVAFAALARRYYVVPEIFSSLGWAIICLASGLAAGFAFHHMDSNNYISAGAAAALDSPTKLAHDFVAYPVLFGGLLCVGIPLLVVRSNYTWLVLACVGVWVLFGVCDARRGLNPLDMHPEWDESSFSSIK
jgi:hypothetical protein